MEAVATTKKQQEAKLKRLDRAARVLYGYVVSDADPNYESLTSFTKSHYIKIAEEIIDAYNE